MHTHLHNRSAITTLGLVALATIGFGLQTNANTFLNLETFPQDWTLHTVRGSSGGTVPSAADVIEFEGADWLRIRQYNETVESVTTTHGGSTVAFYTGSNSQISNVTGSIILRNATSSSGGQVYPLGIVVGAQNTDYNDNGGFFIGVQARNGTVGGEVQTTGMGIYENSSYFFLLRLT